MTDDAFWMCHALRLARRVVGWTSPNPPVGAVIVKDGVLIALRPDLPSRRGRC